jgi:hypothetical protein
MHRDQTTKCATCGNALVPLFFSSVCEFCETKPAYECLNRGWIVWRDLAPGFPHYVFPSKNCAELWRKVRNNNSRGTQVGNNSGVPRLVLSKALFSWGCTQSGLLRDIPVANHLVAIFPDHKFKPAQHRAFLAPLEFERACK